MSYNILVLDDSRSMRKVLIKSIKMCNIGEVSFYQAINGLEGLEILKDIWVDMIFSDINMPEMDGFTFVQNVRKNDVFEKTPIIIITSETRQDTINEKLNGMIEGIILKPFRPEEIKLFLTEHLHLEENTDDEDSDFEGFDF